MKIKELKLPALQVALDFTSLNRAIEVLSRISDLDIGIVEVGTPLIKSEGARSISRVRELAGGKPVLADTKTVDVGALEAEIAIRAGADFLTAIASADDAVIESAARAAWELGGDLVVDFIGFRGDVLSRARELSEVGISSVNIHVGIDVQRSLGLTATDMRILVKRLSAELSGLVISVSGGIKPEDIPQLIDAGAQIVVVGGAITRSSDPREAAVKCLKALKRIR
ncbi:MAG: orotidine 5'-phosphate decarboxylase / HUMPS family protein [Sulfolobales archaeon]